MDTDRPGLHLLRLIYDDPYNPWLGGGGAVRAFQVARRLADRGHRVTLVVGGYPGARRSELQGRLHLVRTRPGRHYLTSRLAFAVEGPGFVRQGRFDVVMESFTPFSPVFAPLHTRRPVVAVCQQVLLGRQHLTDRGPVGLIPWGAEWLALQLYHRAITDSPHLAATLQARLRQPARIRFIPNGVDDALFQDLPGPAGAPPYVLFLGRLDIRQKGLDRLLDLWAAHPHLPRLVVAGTGRDAALVARRVAHPALQGRVALPGRVRGKEKVRLLQQAALVCLPSRFESFPVVALEAQAGGRPLVATRLPSFQEATRPGCSAVLIPPDDDRRLLIAIQDLLGDCSRAGRMGACGRDFARQFGWEGIVDQVEEELWRACRQKRR